MRAEKFKGSQFESFMVEVQAPLAGEEGGGAVSEQSGSRRRVAERTDMGNRW